MLTILRTYLFTEFEAEFGPIIQYNKSEHIFVTSHGTALIVSEPYLSAINHGILTLERSCLKHQVALFLDITEYLENGSKINIPKWFLYPAELITREVTNNNIFFKNVSWIKCVRRQNYCRIIIQFINNNFESLYIIDHTDIYLFEDLGNRNYRLQTSRGVFEGQYKSKNFILSFAKVMSINSTEYDKSTFDYIIFADGSFEKSEKTNNRFKTTLL